MASDTSDWMNQLGGLPPEQRAELAYRLIQSLDEPADADWESAWAEELRKRAERMKSGARVGIPFEDVMARLRKKFK